MSDKQAFLEEKAKNFKAYLESYSPDDTLKAYIKKFDPKTLNLSIQLLLLPVVVSGTEDAAATQLLSSLQVKPDEVAEVKAKLIRYFRMFVDVITSL